MSERRTSQLRTHLEAAQAEYRAARYPGDLAGELLPSRLRIGVAGRLARTSGAAAAIAAMVMLAVWLRRPVGNDVAVPTPTNGQWAIATTQQTPTPFTVTVETDASVEMPLAA